MSERDWFPGHRVSLIILLPDYLVWVWSPEHVDRCPHLSMHSFQRHVKTKDTEWEAFWACVIVGNWQRLSKEVSELSACHFFHSEVKPFLHGCENYWGHALCSCYGVFWAFKWSRIFISEVSCAKRRWFIMYLSENKAIWSIIASLL